MARIIIYIALLCFIGNSEGKNYLSYVCHSFSSYSTTRAYKSNCYFSGDVLNSFEEIARFYGYNIDVFEVVTEDQYILKLFRISPVKRTSVGAPVLLAHGIITSATTFALVGNRSLAFLLADEGYDVWLMNFRGTSYSNKHALLTSDDKRYWDFSMHEYGIYDIKSTINFVTNTSKQKVIFIGWSLGAMSYFIYNTMHPDEAIQKVRVSISLAPTVYKHGMKVPILKIIKPIPFWIFKGIFDVLFPKGVFYQKTPEIIKSVLHLCFDSPFQVLLCEIIKDMFTGFGIRQEAPETFPTLAAQSTEATGVKMVYHIIQLVQSKKLQQYDYGNARNLIRYGTPNPPLYNISLVNIPIYIIYGPNDFLAPEEEVKFLYHALPKEAKVFGEPYRVKNEDFCHSDMVAARDIKTLLNDHILQFLKENAFYFNN